MKPVRRTLLCAIGCWTMLGAAWAQGDFPNKQITLVVPFAAGGVTDQIGRTVAQKLQDNVKVPVIVENKSGGSSQIAAGFVKQLPADGYTLLLAEVGTLSLNPNLYAKLSYDPAKDFVAVARLVNSAGLVVVPAASPVRSMAELVALSKAKPDGLSLGSQGTGSGGHLFIELLRGRTGGKFNHIPYRGSAPAMTDLVGGQIDAMYDAILSTGPFVRDGKLRPLATSASQRLPDYPNVPTLQELGLGETSVLNWFGIVVKSGTPAPVVARLAQELSKAVTAPDVARRLSELGLSVAPQTPDEFRRYIDDETARWGKVIRDGNIKLE